MASKNLKIDIKSGTISKEVATIIFDGELDAGSINKISACFDTIRKDGKKYVIIDMSKVSSVSSAALGELMGGRKLMIELGGDLVLAGMNLEVRTKLSLMGANKIFRFFNDLRTAVNAYKWEFQHQADAIKLSFPSNLKFVPPVRQLVSRIAKQKGYGNRDSFRIETIVDEVCNNAVEHGVQGSDDDIDMSINIDKDKIELNVINVSDPQKAAALKALLKTSMEKQLKIDDRRGRGLALIKMLSNKMSVDFSDKGTSVHVTKVREE